MNTLFLILLLIVAVMYNLTIDKVPESLSATAYISHIGPGCFTLYCLVTGILLLIPWFNLTPDEWQFLPFLSCAGMCFAGVTPAFRQEFEKPIHYSVALIAFLAWMAWVIIVGVWWHLPILVAVWALTLLWDRDSWVFYAEVLALNYTVIYLVWLITSMT